MTETMKKKRDYSLVGESTRRAIETGLASAEWYHTDVSRKTMKELMQRSDGPAIRDTIIWIVAILGSAAGAHLFLGHLVVRAVLLRLRRALRLVERLALARMRARHRLQDALDERRRLPDRQLHADAQSGDLALEPCAPSHRHDHRRPRRRDRGDASAGPVAHGAGLRRHQRFPLCASRRWCATRFGNLSPDEKSYIPEMEQHKAIVAARWHVAIYAATDSARASTCGRSCR